MNGWDRDPYRTEQLIRSIRGGSKCGKLWATTILPNRQFPASHPSFLSWPLIAGPKICIHNGPIDVRSFDYLPVCRQNADVPVYYLGSQVLR